MSASSLPSWTISSSTEILPFCKVRSGCVVTAICKILLWIPPTPEQNPSFFPQLTGPFLPSGPFWPLQPHSSSVLISHPHITATQNFFPFLKQAKLPQFFQSLHVLFPLPGILCPANSYHLQASAEMLLPPGNLLGMSSPKSGVSATPALRCSRNTLPSAQAGPCHTPTPCSPVRP